MKQYLWVVQNDILESDTDILDLKCPKCGFEYSTDDEFYKYCPKCKHKMIVDKIPA